METDNTIESSMAKTIAESDLSDIGADVMDAALDDLPIPVFSTLRKFYRGVRSIQNYFYLKKIVQYLRGFSEIPAAQRHEQLEKLLIDGREEEKFGAHICLVLDRLNDIDKASLMGKVSRALLLGKITLEQLKSLNFAIDAIDMRLLPELKSFVGSGWRCPENAKQSLASCGLLILRLDVCKEDVREYSLDSGSSRVTGQVITSAEMQYALTELGRLFCETCLD